MTTRQRRSWPAVGLLLVLVWLIVYPDRAHAGRGTGRAGGVGGSHYRPDLPGASHRVEALWGSLWISARERGARRGDRGAARLSLRARRVPRPCGCWAPSWPSPSCCRRSSGCSPSSFSTARPASFRCCLQTLFGLTSPRGGSQGAGAMLLVHAYSMYVYFYLFTRAGARLARRLAPRGGGEPGRPDAGAPLRRVVLPLLLSGARRRRAPHLHDIARPPSGRPTSSAAASG